MCLGSPKREDNQTALETLEDSVEILITVLNYIYLPGLVMSPRRPLKMLAAEVLI